MGTQFIQMEKSWLLGYKGKIKFGVHGIQVEIGTEMTTKIAEQLEVRYTLFDKDSIPKPFSKIELETEFHNTRCTFTIPGLQQHSLIFESKGLNKFVVQRKGDGKKKKKVLALRFQAHYSGNIHDLIDTFEKLGSGEGLFTIEALQTTLPFEPPKPPKRKHTVVQ